MCRLVFWLSLLPGVIAVLIIIFFIRDTADKGQKHSGTELPEYRNLRAEFDWRYRAFVAISTLFAIGNSSDVFLILRATGIGIKETQIPLLYLSFNLIYSVVSMPAGILSDRFGRKRVILSGYLLFALIYWGFAEASAVRHIWGLFLLYGIFMGLTEGIQKAYIADLIPKSLTATGFGIYNTFVGLAVLPASILGGFLWDKYGPQATFYFGAFTASVSALLLIIIYGLDFKRKRGV